MSLSKISEIKVFDLTYISKNVTSALTSLKLLSVEADQNGDKVKTIRTIESQWKPKILLSIIKTNLGKNENVIIY